jgi:hypothetical protein
MGEVRRIPAVDVEHVRVARMSSSRLRCPCLDVISMHLLHHRSDGFEARLPRLLAQGSIVWGTKGAT